MRGLTVSRSPVAAVAGLFAALAVVLAVVVLADMRAEAQDETWLHEMKLTLQNDTGSVASDLHIEFSEPVKVNIVDVTGSTCPDVNIADIPDGPIVDINWGVKCVDNDPLTEVSVTVLSAGEEDPGVLSILWTKDASITPGPSPTLTPTEDGITFPTLPPPTATDIGPPPTIPLDTQVPQVPTVTATSPLSGPTSTAAPTTTPTAPTSTPTTPTATPGTPTATAGTPTATATHTNTVLPTVTPTPTVLPGGGDVNCNRNIDSIDALLILQLIARRIATLQCEFAADANQNGVVDSVDAALLLQFIAGLIPALPIGP